MAIVIGQSAPPAEAPETRSEPQAAEPRQADPFRQRLRLAFRLLMETHHVGIENAATWEALRAELVDGGMKIDSARRLQEAASYLRRVEKVAIGGTSQSGIFVVAHGGPNERRERRLIAAERVKRIRAEAQELRAIDESLYLRIQDALPAIEDGMEREVA